MEKFCSLCIYTAGVMHSILALIYSLFPGSAGEHVVYHLGFTDCLLFPKRFDVLDGYCREVRPADENRIPFKNVEKYIIKNTKDARLGNQEPRRVRIYREIVINLSNLEANDLASRSCVSAKDTKLDKMSFGMPIYVVDLIIRAFLI